MNSDHHIIKKQALQLVDLTLILCATFVAFPIRNWLAPRLDQISFLYIESLEGVFPKNVSPVLFGILPLVPIFLDYTGFYSIPKRFNFFISFKIIIKSLILTMGCLAALSVALNFQAPNRSVLLVMCCLIVGGLLIRLISLDCYTRKASYRISSSVLLVGSSSVTEDFVASILLEDFELVDVVGSCDLMEETEDDFVDLLTTKSVDRVIFITRKISFEKLSKAVEVCELMGIETCISADFINSQIARPSFDIIFNKPMLVINPTPSLSWQVIAKRVMDRAGAAILLLVTFPVWVFCAIGILLADGRPIFYGQLRAGKYGRPFKMWKFRTMCKDAEQRLSELKSKHGNNMSGPVFKLDEDPRVFKFGSFLRRNSLDELPQLFNVFIGELSLVGPRPMACYELPEIEKSSQRRKLSVKPGITCIWQVEGRNTITQFEDWVKLDLKYIDEWSLWLDIKILFKTIPAVLFSKGAK